MIGPVSSGESVHEPTGARGPGSQVGRTGAGLPVGVQVVAPYLHDREAISIAGLLADVAGGYDVPPGY